MAQGLAMQLAEFVAPLLVSLHRVMDKWLVRTFFQTVQVILAFRDRVNGLVLSELGGYLTHPSKGPAGTKRLSNVLHCLKWKVQDVDDFLWQQADQQVETWQQEGEVGLATLAYAFLLQLLRACFDPLRLWLLRTYCHRTGWHLRRVKAPLYRCGKSIPPIGSPWPDLSQL